MNANSYFRQFNLQVQNLLSIKSDDNINLLNRTLSMLCSSQNIVSFDPEIVENCQFYINLYKIINIMGKDSDALWSCITLLQHACKNHETRYAVVNKFKFFPLLAYVLKQLVAEEKISKILNLMEDLSYGIEIRWEEPYLASLIQILLREINRQDETLAHVSLSVLINICYKNFPAICLLMKSINSSSFCEKIKPFGILANKMFIILEINNISSIDIVDLHLFIKMSFLELQKAVQNWNVPLLKHIVEFVIDSKDHGRLQAALADYNDFETDISALIQAIKTRLEMDNTAVDNIVLQKNMQVCLSIIFEFFNYILESNFSNQKPLISEDFYIKIYEFCNIWMLSEYAGDKAIQLVAAVIKFADNNSISQISIELNTLSKLMYFAENNERTNKYITELQKLLITLLKNNKTQNMTLATVKESYFNNVFTPLLQIKPEELYIKTFTDDDLSRYIYTFFLLIEFSNISKTAWIENVQAMFTLKQLQFVLAKGILSENENLCNVVFEISIVECFPKKQVAKVISNLNKLILQRNQHHRVIKNSMDMTGFSSDATYLTYISKDCEEQLNALIDKILKSNRNSELNPASSELIELFNYKINMLNNKIESHKKKLEHANEEITQLSHEVCLHSSELKTYHGINFQMHIKKESLETEKADLAKQLGIFKSGIEELGNKFKKERQKYQNDTKTLHLKNAEISDLQKELNKMKITEINYCEEIKKLSLLGEENARRNEQLKQSLILTEDGLKDKEKSLEVKINEVNKLNKHLEDQREALTKSENLIIHLESQITDKNETIRTLENELNETEDMRKTILSLMESKKPKRKA